MSDIGMRNMVTVKRSLQKTAIWLLLLGLLLPKVCSGASPPPTITVQPLSQTVPFQGSVTFSVVASTTTTLSYQWRKNGGNISGATQSAYTISPVQTTDAATYTVKVTNAGGSVTSSGATLTVLVPPTITAQPQNQTATQSLSATFSVIAGGAAPIKYQWRYNGIALAGATSSALALTGVQTNDAGSYTVVVTNSWGSVTSAVATLTVLVPPGIATQPQSQAVTVGQAASFSVVASGTTPFTYQWYLNTAMLGRGSTSSTYTDSNVKTGDAGDYTVVVANAAGSVTSVVATLTVYVPPSISGQPSSAAAVQDQTASFSVTASGSPVLSYQWNVNGTNLIDGPNISGSATATLTLSNVQPAQAGNVFVVITNLGGSIISHVKTLTVYVPATITNQPQSLTVTQSQTAWFSVGAVGTPNLSYQWYLNNVKMGSGSTSPTLTLSSVGTNNAGNYTVVVNNDYGSVTSAVAALTVLVPAQIATQPTSQALILGQDASFSVGAFGDAPLSYQWSFNGGALSGATTSALALSNVQTNQAGNYTVLVANTWGTVTSSNATLTVYVPPAITMQPLSQTVTQGLTASLSVVASGTTPFSYQWQYLGNNVAGATDATLVLANVQLAQAGNYSVAVSNVAGMAASAPAFLTVIPPPGNDQPTMQGLVAHLTFDTDLTDSSGRGNHAAAVGAPNLVPGFIGTGAFNPFTQNGTNNYATFGTPSDLSFGATSDFSIAFWARLPAGGWGGASYTEPPFIGNKNFHSYANVGWVLATGPDGKLEWNYTEALPNVQHNYFGPAGAFGNPAWHHVAVTFQRGLINTATTYLDGVSVSTVSIGLLSTSIDTGLPTNIGNDGTGNYPTAYGYFTNAFGIPTNGLAMDDVGIWRRALLPTEIGAIYNAGLAGQDLATVTSANLTTAVLPRISQQPVSLEVIAGSPVTFSVTASGPAPFGCQWFANGIPITGATSTSLTLSNVQPAQAGSYFVVLTNSAASLTSAVAALTVDAPPSITAPPENQTVTPGQSASFSIVAAGTGLLGYQWLFNGTPLVGATTAALALSNVQATDAGSYTAVVTNSWGSVTSAVATLTVLVPPGITTQPQSLTVIQGNSASFSIMASGTAPLSYQWSLNGTDLSGATSSTLTLNTVQPTDAGSYAAVVTNVAGSVTSTVAALAVTPSTLPSFDSAGMTSSGFTMQLSVPMGSTYVILASTNLQDWTPISTNVALTSSAVLTDATATNSSRRYYRVILQ